MRRKKDQKKKEDDDEGKIVLTKDMLLKGLCDFGMQDSLKTFGYRKLALSNLNLEFLKNIILDYRSIQYIDLSNNQLADFQLLSSFDHLVYLNISNNKIKHINYLGEEEKFPNLQRLEAQNNKITEVPLLKAPKLQYLDVSGNSITKYDRIEGGHPSLTVFKGNQNRFKSLYLFKDMPKLKEIYLDDNVITIMNDYENIPELQVLSLKRNKIDKLEEDLPELPNLTKLNLRGNKISNKEYVKKLVQYPALKQFNIMENPVFEEGNEYAAHEIIMLNTKLQKVNKVRVTPTILQEAIFLGELLWRKQEDERIAKEKEAQEKAEREAAQGESQLHSFPARCINITLIINNELQQDPAATLQTQQAQFDNNNEIFIGYSIDLGLRGSIGGRERNLLGHLQVEVQGQVRPTYGAVHQWMRLYVQH
eukprot:TRINITY_DN253_c0_g1_i2.p1 TRINITY_DN253_c0_g1~~TRINITY_DN253_c0_g1_i2.p1  ORF type:complete len:421 (+),score=70.27 TRINITY_DN253_c0_g1_i2:1087-2349(+)